MGPIPGKIPARSGFTRPFTSRTAGAGRFFARSDGELSGGARLERTKYLFCPEGAAAPGEADTIGRENLKQHCLRGRDTVLLDQWDRARNAPLTPEQVAPGSHQKVWWRCRQGHSWQAEVKSRVKGTGCPVCAGKRTQPGENDLAALRPDLAAQWDDEKNAPLTPEGVTPGSHKKVWWRCGRGHSWQAMVIARAAGEGCPVCAGKVVIPGQTDLATLFPDLAAQWDGERNGPLAPDRVAPYSNRKVWWRCPRGHAYQAAVSARTYRGTGCPYCAGKKVLSGFNDLAALHPRIAAQWHPVLNGALTPEMVTAGSRRAVWWQCPEGHVWKARVHTRTGPQRCGCPVCAGRARVRDPGGLPRVRDRPGGGEAAGERSAS